jgi:hypothetical protein
MTKLRKIGLSEYFIVLRLYIAYWRKSRLYGNKRISFLSFLHFYKIFKHNLVYKYISHVKSFGMTVDKNFTLAAFADKPNKKLTFKIMHNKELDFLNEQN